MISLFALSNILFFVTLFFLSEFSQKYHGASRPPKTRRGRQHLSQQPQQQEAARTSLEGAQYRPYPSSSKTLKDTVTGEDKEVEKKAGPPMKKMCKICGVKTSSTWHLAPPGEVSGVICDTCSLQAKLRKVGEKIQQRIGRRSKRSEGGRGGW